MKKPDWLKLTSHFSSSPAIVTSLLKKLAIRTVCEGAACPNRLECFGQKTAAFLILGPSCTRTCAFCDVLKGTPEVVDPGVPSRIAQAVKGLTLQYAVITSVTRDDLADGGASHFAGTILAIRAVCPATAIEVLIPDFLGSLDSLRTITDARPLVIAHNIETVPRLYPSVREMADYGRSLFVLKTVKELKPSIMTKSGIMLGMGETAAEVIQTLSDLRTAGCGSLTIGQYLAPSMKHYPVKEYITPAVFESYRQKALAMGFSRVASGPLVRSSYHAGVAD